MDVYQLLLYLAIILSIGFVLGKLAEVIRIPEITGYIVAGVLLGPSVLNIVNDDVLHNFNVISNVVLGIIAYQIGTELWIPKFKKTGKQIMIITAIQAFITALVVFLGVLLLDGRAWLALALSSIAVATAPAPIMVIVKKLRAKGPVTDVVLPLVGIDDIFGVVIFGLFASIALSLISGQELNIHTALLDPLKEVALSIGIGFGLGLILVLAHHFGINYLKKKDRYVAYLALELSLIFLSVWIAHKYNLSMILIPMTIGMTFTNFISKEPFDIQAAALSNFSGPLIILFFTIAGIELSLKVLLEAGIIAIFYIALRSIGKIAGAYVGAVVAKAPDKVKKYTGICLLPQGGVAIGMLVAISTMFPNDEAKLVQTIVLAGILIFELFGPVLFKKTIEKIGESRENLESA
ncbi:MAG: cation:proton antiporter [Bacilli bacterium]|nr:cation:proton antiporter [Bacilli bacterium]